MAKAIYLNPGRRQKKTSTLPTHHTASPSCRITLFYISYMQGHFVEEFHFFQCLREKVGRGKERKGEEKRRGEESGVGAFQRKCLSFFKV